MIHCWQSTFVTRCLPLQVYGTCFYRSTTKLADTLAANKERKCVSLNSNDIISKKYAYLINRIYIPTYAGYF